MNPHAEKLKRLLDATTANWVEMSADDLLEASRSVQADSITMNLEKAAQEVLRGRVLGRRGVLPVRLTHPSRKDLEHLLSRLEAAAVPQVPSGEVPFPGSSGVTRAAPFNVKEEGERG